MNAVQVYDFNRDGRMDLVISKDRIDQLGRLYYYADLYRATPLMSVEERRSLQLGIQLLQNYPNPFNPSTEIRFDLPAPGNVSLVVYDILGRNMAQLVSGVYEAGSHTATWNAQDFPSGIYFARFAVTDSEGKMLYGKVNKLVLMK